jgi:hypothetical protein
LPGAAKVWVMSGVPVVTTAGEPSSKIQVISSHGATS